MQGPNNFKISTAVIAFALTLGIALGGYTLYRQVGVAKPLVKSVSEIPGVKRVTVLDNKDKSVINVQLAGVQDLRNTYSLLKQDTAAKLGQTAYELELKDNADQAVNRTYQELEAAIYEGVAGNRFIWLKNELEKKAEENGIQYRLQVDADYVYIALYDRHSGLYRVIERTPEQQAGKGV